MKLYMKYFIFEVLNFSGLYIRNCINCGHNCGDHSLIDFTSAVQYITSQYVHCCTGIYIFALVYILLHVLPFWATVEKFSESGICVIRCKFVVRCMCTR